MEDASDRDDSDGNDSDVKMKSISYLNYHSSIH